MNSPHDAPSATELLAAVTDFLRDDVMAVTEGRVRFHARVSANVLDVVAREIDATARHERRHRQRLEALGQSDDIALARAIRDGDVDHRDPELLRLVHESVIDKLEVARPGHLGASPPG